MGHSSGLESDRSPLIEVLCPGGGVEPSAYDDYSFTPSNDPMFLQRASDFVEDEIEYLYILNIITQTLNGLKVLANHPEFKVIDTCSIYDIFSNIEDLRDLSESLVPILKAVDMSTECTFEVSAGILKVFNEIHFKFHVYSIYLGNLERAINLISRASASLPTFRHFLMMEERLCGIKFQDLMRIPEIRMQQYYRFVNYLASEDNKSCRFRDSMNLVDYTVHAFKQTIIMPIAQEIIFRGSLGLINEDRYLVRAGNVEVECEKSSTFNTGRLGIRWKRRQEFMVFLFNDIVLFSIRSTGEMKMRQVIRLRDLSIFGTSNSDELSFSLLGGPEMGELKIVTPNTKTRDTWFKRFKKYIAIASVTKVDENDVQPIEKIIKRGRVGEIRKIRTPTGSKKWVKVVMSNGIKYYYEAFNGLFTFALARPRLNGQSDELVDSPFTENRCLQCERRALAVQNGTYHLCIEHVTEAKMLIAKTDIDPEYFASEYVNIGMLTNCSEDMEEEVAWFNMVEYNFTPNNDAVDSEIVKRMQIEEEKLRLQRLETHRVQLQEQEERERVRRVQQKASFEEAPLHTSNGKLSQVLYPHTPEGKDVRISKSGFQPRTPDSDYNFEDTDVFNQPTTPQGPNTPLTLELDILEDLQAMPETPTEHIYSDASCFNSPSSPVDMSKLSPLSALQYVLMTASNASYTYSESRFKLDGKRKKKF